MYGLTTLTPSGTAITLETPEAGDWIDVYLDHDDAPDDMRHTHAGRIVSTPDGGHGFQPVSHGAYALGPEALRALATLIDTLER